jgi:hypothetical protein
MGAVLPSRCPADSSGLAGVRDRLFPYDYCRRLHRANGGRMAPFPSIHMFAGSAINLMKAFATPGGDRQQADADAAVFHQLGRWRRSSGSAPAAQAEVAVRPSTYCRRPGPASAIVTATPAPRRQGLWVKRHLRSYTYGLRGAIVAADICIRRNRSRNQHCAGYTGAAQF